jgi:hypothetical protein
MKKMIEVVAQGKHTSSLLLFMALITHIGVFSEGEMR